MSQQFWKNNSSAWTVFFIWVGLLATALLAGHNGHTAVASAMATWGRMGSSVALVLLAGLAYTQVEPPSRRYALLTCLGMLLGTIGDFFNADLLKFIPLKDGTLGAIGAFGLGHLCYMAASIGVIRSIKTPSPMKIVIGIAVWQVIGLLSWYLIVYPGQNNRALIWPALGYTMLLSGTAGVGTGLAWHINRMWPLAVGAGLFLASDLLLAIGMFRGSYPFRSEAVWLTYGPGQMLIVVSAWLVSSRDGFDERSDK